MHDARLLYLAGLLIVIGALPGVVFRFTNATGYGPTVLALSFHDQSGLNTISEYRFYEHGRIMGVDRIAYHRNLPIAIGILFVQWLCWFPALIRLAFLGARRASWHWPGVLMTAFGIMAWAISEMSAFWH